MQEIYLCLIEEFDWDGNYIYNQTYHTSKANAWKWGRKVWLEMYALEFDEYRRTGYHMYEYWKFERGKKLRVQKIEIKD